jgi:hypothetical protein
LSVAAVRRALGARGRQGERPAVRAAQPRGQERVLSARARGRAEPRGGAS